MAGTQRLFYYRQYLCSSWLLVKIIFGKCYDKRYGFAWNGEFRQQMGNNQKCGVILKKWSREKPVNWLVYRLFWRRVRDSNPRYITYTAFRVLHLRPLGQLSVLNCIGKRSQIGPLFFSPIILADKRRFVNWFFLKSSKSVKLLAIILFLM